MPRRIPLRLWLFLGFLAIVPAQLAPAAERDDRRATRNVIFVTTDGLRWQEVFRGADDALMNKENGGVTDVAGLRRDFWRETAEERREVLMPFLWSVVARQGQVYGNADKGSVARVTNGMNFSYPGYNELFTGSADPRIDSNAKRPNPNRTVLEWLNDKPAYRGKVAAIGSWDVYPFILNRERSGLAINAGWEPLVVEPGNERVALLNQVQAQAPRMWDDCRDDALTFPLALEMLRALAPRVFYIGLGDTDEHAHGGRYDKYLRAAQIADANLKRLWDELQAHPQYRGTTTLIVTTDHGRGDPPRGWRDHGAKVAGAESIWLAILGPDTPALGERTDVAPVTQSQVAATLAGLLGEDYRADVPAAAPGIADAIRPASGDGR